jgi:PAS domain S-box-containing protein
MDIRTLIVVLGITHVLQVIVFAFQASVNKSYRGIGWWLLWSTTGAAGFLFMMLRGIPALLSIAIIAQNSLIVLAAIFLNVGIMRFLDKKEKRGILFPIFILFLTILIYFLFVYDDIGARTVAISLTLAAVSFMTARELWANKFHSIKTSTRLIAAVFLTHGIYFILRAVMIISGTPFHDMFSPSLINVSAYLDGIIVSLLWTYGLIIMINQRSGAEMTEAKLHFESIFNTSPDAAAITSLDEGVILDVNHAFTAMTGFSRQEAVGRSSTEAGIWKIPSDRRKVTAGLREKGFVENFETEFLRKDGSRLYGLMSAKIIILRGASHIISVTRDISERKRAEEALRQSVKQKEILMKELQHRVKNSLAVVSSLLGMGMERLADARDKEIIVNTRSRIHSISSIHDRLYSSAALDRVDLCRYVGDLAESLFKTYTPESGNIRIKTDLNEIDLDTKRAMPLGLILNELITNALKYAYPAGAQGDIRIGLHKADDKITLHVSDDGVGLPEGFDPKTSAGEGMSIVRMLVDEIDGELTFDRNKGTSITIRLKA